MRSPLRTAAILGAVLLAIAAPPTAASTLRTLTFSTIHHDIYLSSNVQGAEFVEQNDVVSYTGTLDDSGQVEYTAYNDDLEPYQVIVNATANNHLTFDADLAAGQISGSSSYNVNSTEPGYLQASSSSSIQFAIDLTTPHYYTLTLSASGSGAPGALFTGALDDANDAFNFGREEGRPLSLTRSGIIGTQPFAADLQFWISTGPGCFSSCIGDPSGSFSFNLALTPVPLPAAAWLFISGLGGLVLVGRRRRIHTVTG